MLKDIQTEMKKQTEIYQKLTESNNQTIGNTIMVSQIRSLLIYKYSPLMASKYLKIEEIDKMGK
ncbi:hypothetical protein OXYTRIMIC_641 [Oxytricha trifallax]|uniref:Uncharacterized protein n=1 Tax=Oxytricha trifallax TaxID=1172189 RepID=A0A073HZW0_9SPIT|nr:hypothetical protein OXYTRIMIC_641 [Oxytricha trifallax]